MNQHVLLLHNLGDTSIINGGPILLIFLILLTLGAEFGWLLFRGGFFCGGLLLGGFPAACGLVVAGYVLDIRQCVVFEH